MIGISHTLLLLCIYSNEHDNLKKTLVNKNCNENFPAINDTVKGLMNDTIIRTKKEF